MSDCSHGPVSSMPGSRHKLPVGTMCDRHEDRPAVARVQGETDSMGCEYVDACQECLDGFMAYDEARRTEEHYCDWHKGMGLDVRPHRDFEEGLAGPVYHVCADCRHKEAERLAEEFADEVIDDRFDDLGPEDWTELDDHEEEILREPRQTPQHPQGSFADLFKEKGR